MRESHIKKTVAAVLLNDAVLTQRVTQEMQQK